MEISLKKLIRDYQYNLETLHDVKEISSVAEGQFRNAMQEEDPEALNALSNPDAQNNKEDIEETHIDNGPKFKKIFRKAAVKCHPDKLSPEMSDREQLFMKECYENLNKANDNNDWGMLLKVALDLDIEFGGLGPDELNNISEQIENLKKDISKYENSMAYSWYNQNSEEQKRLYLAECAKIFRKSIGL